MREVPSIPVGLEPKLRNLLSAIRESLNSAITNINANSEGLNGIRQWIMPAIEANNDLTIFSQAQINAALESATGADGAAGIAARAVSLTTPNQSFTYDTNGANPSPATSVITATIFNTVGVVYYEFFLNDVSTGTATTSNTYTYTPKSTFTGMPDKLEVQIREDGLDGAIKARDQMTMVGLKAGSHGITVMLSNEAHTLPRSIAGVVTYTGSGTKINVWEGATALTEDSSSPYANSTFRVTTAATGITPGSITGTGTTTLTYGDANSMTTSPAKIDFTIIAKRQDGTEITIAKQQSLSYSQAGAGGDSVDIVFVRAASQPATPTASSGTPTAPITWYTDVASVPVSANPLWASTGFKTSASANYTWDTPVRVEGASVAEVTVFTRGVPTSTPTGGTYTFSNPPVLVVPTSTGATWYTSIPSGTTAVYTSRAVVSTSAGNTSAVAITGWTTPVISLQNGADAVLSDLSNDNHTVPTDSSGSNGNFTGCATTMSVFIGSSDDSTNWTYAVTKSTGVTCTEAITSRTQTVTAMTTDTGTVTIVASKSGYANQTQVFSISKAKSGVAYQINLSDNSVRKSAAGVLSPTTLTLTASKIDVSSVTAYSGRFKIYLNGSATATYTSAADEASKAYTVTATDTTIKCELYLAGGTTTLVDAETVLVVADGATGTSVYTGTIYQQITTATAPSGGSYNFSTGVLTAPASWTTTPPTTTTTPTWACDYTFSTNTPTTSVTAGTWTNLHIDMVKGADGITGTRTAILDLYQWSNSVPTLFPSGTSTYTWATGQFTNPATLNSWTATPASPTAGQVLYVCHAFFADSLTTATSIVTWSTTVAIPSGSAGNNGNDSSSYALNLSSSVISKSVLNVLTPTSSTASIYKSTGTTSPALYAGRFIIATSPDGTTYTDVYTSSADESSKAYTIPTTAKTIRVRAYLAGGVTTLLDEEVITIVTDGASGIDSVNNIVAVLNNENQSIPADNTGTTGAFSAVSTMAVYNGAIDDSANWTYTKTDSSTTSSISGATTTVTALSADTGTVTITATRSAAAQVNILSGSETFDATWSDAAALGNTGVVVATSTIPAPNGALTAKKITANAGLVLYYRKAQTFAASQYSVSTYVYVPTQAGITSWSLSWDFADTTAVTASIPTYYVFDKWVRAEGTATTSSSLTFLDWNINMNGAALTAGTVFHVWGGMCKTGVASGKYIPYLAPVSKVFTLAKAKAGSSAPIFSINNSAVTFAKGIDNVILPATLALTTAVSNVTTPTYQWYKSTDGGSTYTTIASAIASSYTITSATDYASVTAITYKCIVTGTINGVASQTLNDAITIPLLSDSKSAVSVVLSNENISFPALVTGYTGVTFTGGNCDVTAFIGTTQLTPTTIAPIATYIPAANVTLTTGNYAANYIEATGTLTCTKPLLTITAIDTALGVITIASNGFNVLTSIRYSYTGAGATIGGLVNNTNHYAVPYNSNSFYVTVGTTSTSAGSFVVGKKYVLHVFGTTTQTQWNTITGVASSTHVSGEVFTCANAGVAMGTGTAFELADFTTSSLVAGNVYSMYDMDWNSGLVSTTSFTGGAKLTFMATAGSYAMMGLNTDPVTNTSYASIDYAIYVAGTAIYIFESGINKATVGTYTSTDLFTILYNNDTVSYYKNGIRLYSTDVAKDLTLYVDSSLVYPNAYNASSISNIGFSAYVGPAANTFTYDVLSTNLGTSVMDGTVSGSTFAIPTPTNITAETAYVDVLITPIDAAKNPLATITKRINYSLSRAGVAGTPATYVTVTGEQSFKFATGSATPTSTSITLTAALTGGLTTYQWDYWNGTAWATLSGTVNTSTYALAYNNAAFTANSLRVRCISGTAFDEITIVKLYDGATGVNAVSGYLTNETVAVATDSNGNGAVYTSAGGTFKVFNGTTDVTTSTAFTTTAAVSGLTLTIGAATGVYSLAGTWTSDTASFTLTGVYSGTTITKVYKITKSKAGIQGNPGQRIGFLELYIWSAAAPTVFPSGTSTYTWSTGIFTAPATLNGWALVPATAVAGQSLWGISATISNTSTTATDTVTWSSTSPYVVGYAGGNGVSINVVELYQQAASAPALPTGTSYNFSTDTLSGTLGSWVRTMPASSTTPTYMTVCTFTVTAPTTSQTRSVWSTAVIAAQNGSVGSAGVRGPFTTYAPYATAAAWNDAAANSAITNMVGSGGIIIIGDEVTICYPSVAAATYVVTKYASAVGSPATTATWTTRGQVIDGNLMVSGTLSAASLKTSSLTAANAISVVNTSNATRVKMGNLGSSYGLQGWNNANASVFKLDENGLDSKITQNALNLFGCSYHNRIVLEGNYSFTIVGTTSQTVIIPIPSYSLGIYRIKAQVTGYWENSLGNNSSALWREMSMGVYYRNTTATSVSMGVVSESSDTTDATYFPASKVTLQVNATDESAELKLISRATTTGATNFTHYTYIIWAIDNIAYPNLVY